MRCRYLAGNRGRFGPALTSLHMSAPPVGLQLRQWRERRRLSQLELALQADVSTRHLSFVETGRSRPTPDMILRLTEHLEVPLRERNQLLLAGGYAPAYPQHDLDEPELASVRSALRRVLTSHEPYPATVINRWWELVDSNAATGALLAGVAPHLLEPPVNVLRLSLHPDGLAPRIMNLGQWRAHLLEQLNRRRVATGDARLHELAEELRGYPGDDGSAVAATDVVLPLRFRHDIGELSLFSIAASVGTAADVTVDELQIESFYPADADTARLLTELSSRAPS
jgi:transcriptional regulator with XRE-family HTH domain